MTKSKELHVFLRGGLGNQLFQYSTGLALAKAQGRELVLRGDLLPEVEDSISGVSRWPNQISDFHYSGIIQTKSYQPPGRTNWVGKSMQLMRLLGDKLPSLVAKMGWLASENGSSSDAILQRPVRLINSYSSSKNLAFSNRDKLRQEIGDIRGPSKKFLQLTAEMQMSDVVAVHLRQGDYLNLSHIYGSYSLNFLKVAIEELKQIGPEPNIWLFTDTPDSTPEDVLGFLRPQKVIGPEVLTRPLENLILMSRAKALIAANSSFSWWAALLTSAGTPVIAPRILNAKVNNFSIDLEPDENWRTLDVSE
ncbi:MAG: hypothetical protein RL460_54 [Actinomycetota bacterium]